MIEGTTLLRDLKKLLRTLEDDIRTRIGEHPALDASLRAEWAGAREAGRTAQGYAEWREEEVTQAAVHWVLGCVFVRFLEDNGLVERPYLAGPGERLGLARDRHEAYFRAHPGHSDREYLEHVFAEVAGLPAMAALFDRRHNPLWRLGVSGDGAMALLGFFQRVDPDRGALVHNFGDPDWNTRFLGDLYQDLSEAARKRYALLQTPEFVEEFILDRTLDPAVAEFGYREVRLIDPTCGSGHFLLGAFRRLFDLWGRSEPARNLGDLAQRALNAVHGVDLNPFAAAIARFRLLVAALRACEVRRLKDAPNFRIHVAAGDSLLHGRRFRELDLDGEAENLANGGLAHAFRTEDLDDLGRILGRQYHVVVGNPPYITVKDRALNQAYRSRYSACHMKYSLAVPFTERFFELALPSSPPGRGAGGEGAGFVGMITANSFMKREFGRKLIEEFLPAHDLTHVIDTSGAYIPGHGTPTVILFGRNRSPVESTVRTVMGIKGEPATPADPAKGLVWSAVLAQVDLPRSESPFVSVADTPRADFRKHPWSIGGGGAADLRRWLEERAGQVLGDVCREIGFGAVTREDSAYLLSPAAAARRHIPSAFLREMVEGEDVRDYAITGCGHAIWPYDQLSLEATAPTSILLYLWPFKALLERRVAYGLTQLERSLKWFEYSMFFTNRYALHLSIAFGEVATHNHFVLDRGGKVFNRTAPVIKLRAGATEDDHLALLGLLNSSTACFWLKQVCHNKGSTVDQHGARQRTDPFEDFYQYNGTKLERFPLVEPYPTDLARELDRLGQELRDNLPAAVVARGVPERAALDAARERALSIRHRMIALQEELDWRCYRLYGVIDQDLCFHVGLRFANPTYDSPDVGWVRRDSAVTQQLPEIDLGQRAFEIIMARRMAAGELETTWFERHRSTPVTEPPDHWPEDYKAVVRRRIELIETHKYINLIERPEYKRRWQWRPWEEQEREALRDWLLDRLEAPRYWGGEPRLTSTNRLADLARGDGGFMQVAALYTGRSDFDAAKLVADLAAAESVPFLPVLRYTESGLRKRAQWEETWALQRQEDAIDARTVLPEGDPHRLGPEEAKALRAREVGDIPVPPKYRSADFLKSDYWRLRGGLDVPKERFIAYPHCERDADGSLVIAWAGWDPLQQATALATYYLDMKEREGWSTARLAPRLAGLQELLPWLKQWHNEYKREYGQGMGDYFADFVSDELRALDLTAEALRAWTPPAGAARGRRRRREAAS